jgi:hypothetical protein
MTQITIGNINLNVDVQATIDYYKDKPTFLCDCVDCQNYLSQIKSIKNEFNGLDESLGIDLSKDVGIGSDELMPHDYDDHLLYVVPYYVIGSILSPKETSHKINDRLSINIHNYNYNEIMNIKEDAFCMWLEIRLPLLEN